MLNIAPVVLFVYNRPWHTEQTLGALQNNKWADQTTLYVYCDGWKSDATDEDRESIIAVRTLIKKEQWCKEVIIIERSENYGLAENVIDGVTAVVNEHGRIIVLEDDLITSPFFLSYCNRALELYKNEKNVYAINGYQFPIGVKEQDTFLSPLGTSSWGWATWKDRWDCFDEEIVDKDIIQHHPDIRSRFNVADFDFAILLNNSNSWAIRWYYSVFRRNGIGVFVTRSLVYNIGFDGSGEHCGEVSFKQNIYLDDIDLVIKNTINFSLLATYTDTLKFGNSKESSYVNNKRNVVVGRISKILKRLFSR